MEAKTQRAYIQESLVVLLPFHSAAENGSNPNRWYHNTDLELLQHASSPPSFINSGGKKSTFKIGRAGRDSLDAVKLFHQKVLRLCDPTGFSTISNKGYLEELKNPTLRGRWDRCCTLIFGITFKCYFHMGLTFITKSFKKFPHLLVFWGLFGSEW